MKCVVPPQISWTAADRHEGMWRQITLGQLQVSWQELLKAAPTVMKHSVKWLLSVVLKAGVVAPSAGQMRRMLSVHKHVFLFFWRSGHLLCGFTFAPISQTPTFLYRSALKQHVSSEGRKTACSASSGWGDLLGCSSCVLCLSVQLHIKICSSGLNHDATLTLTPKCKWNLEPLWCN